MQTNRAEQKAQEGSDKLVWPRGVINLPDHVYRINMRGIDGFEPGRNSTQRDIVNPLRGGLSEVKRGDHPLKMLYHKIHKKPLTVADVSAALYSAPYHDENFSPLHSTLNLHAKNRIEILKTVLLFNQDVDRKFGKPQISALSLAFGLPRGEREDAVNLIVRHGANVKNVDSNGYNALHYAVIHGCPDVIPTLVKKGAAHTLNATTKSLTGLALERFGKELSGPHQIKEKLDRAFTDLYRTMAHLKQSGLLDKSFELDDFIAQVRQRSKSYPQYNEAVSNMSAHLSRVTQKPVDEDLTVISAYSNPNGGFSYESNTPQSDSWGFFDRIIHNNKVALAMKTSELWVNRCFRNMSSLTKTDFVERMSEAQKSFDIDYVSLDNNPHNDTLLTKCAREGRTEEMLAIIKMNANLHASDANGNTALHLLVTSVHDKEQFLLAAKHLIGFKSENGERQSLTGSDNLADWRIPNYKNETFVDVLAKIHPDWMADVEKHLDVRSSKQDILEWTPDIIQSIGYEVPAMDLRLEAPEHLASESELSAHTHKLCEYLKNRHTHAPESMARDMEYTLKAQSAELKMKALVELISDENPTASTHNAQSVLMRDIANTMASGSDNERRQLFDVFHNGSKEANINLVSLMHGYSMTIGNELAAQGLSSDEIVKIERNMNDASKKLMTTMFDMAEKVFAKEVMNETNVQQERHPK